MFKKYTLFSFLLMVSLLFWAGCKEELLTNKVEIDEEVKAYEFGTGSKWVYRTVMDGDTTWDSLLVTSTIDGEYRINVEPNVDELWSYFRMDWSMEPAGEISYRVISDNKIRDHAGDTDSTHNHGTLLLIQDGPEGEVFYTEDDHSLLVGPKLNQVVSGDTTWPSTYTFTEYPQSASATLRNRSHWVPNVGQVKTEFFRNDTLQGVQELMRWEVFPAD